jgi:hypothetical protein
MFYCSSTMTDPKSAAASTSGRENGRKLRIMESFEMCPKFRDIATPEIRQYCKPWDSGTGGRHLCRPVGASTMAKQGAGGQRGREIDQKLRNGKFRNVPKTSGKFRNVPKFSRKRKHWGRQHTYLPNMHTHSTHIDNNRGTIPLAFNFVFLHRTLLYSPIPILQLEGGGDELFCARLIQNTPFLVFDEQRRLLTIQPQVTIQLRKTTVMQM